MSNLATSYGALGRHNEALAMRESVLEFRRRVLPENHPDIGEGCVRSGHACTLLRLILLFSAMALYNVSFSYETAKAPSRALQCAREALNIRQSALPTGHKDIADAEKRVRFLEQAVQQAGASASVEAATARDGRDA
jgi:hypothetical protein